MERTLIFHNGDWVKFSWEYSLPQLVTHQLTKLEAIKKTHKTTNKEINKYVNSIIYKNGYE